MENFSAAADNHRMKRFLSKLIPEESRPDKVGHRVTAIRETLVMSKAQFADAIGLDRSSLTKVENGELGLDITRGIMVAEMFGFGLNFIYRGNLSDVPLDLRPTLMTNLVIHSKAK